MSLTDILRQISKNLSGKIKEKFNLCHLEFIFKTQLDW